ncbi:MAG: Ig-like domain-containing protein, partial [Verrucomicrobiota bacterium]
MALQRLGWCALLFATAMAGTLNSDRRVFPSGGGLSGTPRFSVVGTFGQAVAGSTATVTTGSRKVLSGFWQTTENTAPVFATVSDRTLEELTTLTLTLSATDGDVPAQTLTYALVSGPSGMTVTAGGVLSWTPTEAQGPGTNIVRVSVTDGVASLTNQFQVVVREVNAAPVLATVSNRTLDELTPLTLTLSATDGDVPAQTLTYALVSGPSGMTVTAGGVLSWTPTEAQGPSTSVVTVSVSDGVTTVPGSFQVVVREVNAAPVLATVSGQTVNELTALTLTLSATDADVPAQTLTYALVTGPTGM